MPASPMFFAGLEEDSSQVNAASGHTIVPAKLTEMAVVCPICFEEGSAVEYVPWIAGRA